MTKKDILSVANKIIGIYVLVQAIETMPSIIGTSMAVFLPISYPGEKVPISWFFYSFAPFFLYVGISFCLIKWSDVIAEKLCGKEELNKIQFGADKEILQETAFSVLGMFIIANALPEIVKIKIISSHYGPLKETFEASMRGSIVESLIKLAIGILLVLGSKNLVGSLKKFRQRISEIKW